MRLKPVLLSVLALSMSIAPAVRADDLTAEQKVSDLRQLTALIKSGYGPLHYKEDMGINVDALFAKYWPMAVMTKTNGEFYYLVRRFVAEFHDSHFGASIPTTHLASAGFTTDLVENQVVVDTVNTTVLPNDQYPIHKGDQVISVDGKDVAKVVESLKRYVGAGYDFTAQRTASMAVSYRAGASFPVPSGPVKFGIKDRSTGTVTEYAMKWVESGNALDEFDPSHVEERQATSRDFLDISINDYWADYAPKGERSFRCSGTTRTAIPDGATIIMMDPFVAYYHPTEHGNVGYLRIPHYSPVNDKTGADEFERRFKQYEYAVSVLEANTVGLIIDQDHNCGGSVDYLNPLWVCS